MARARCWLQAGGRPATVTALLVLSSCAGADHDLAVAYRSSVAVADASLFLEVRGAHADAPVLLWLHGGPGGAERPLFRLFNDDLEQHFRVAYLDQRGAGLSVGGAPDSRLTVEQHLEDLDRIVDYLRNREGTPSLILAGHSWGSLLGALYASRHPGKVSAIVGVSQVVAPLADQKEEFRFVFHRARESGDKAALATLEQLGQPPLDGAAELALDRLIDRFGGSWHQSRKSFRTALGAVSRGLISPFSIPRFITANERSVKAMTPQLLTIDLRRSVKALDVPVILFVGRYDHQISTAAATEWLDRLRAPSKALVAFKRSAHNIPFEEPGAFSACLRSALGSIERSLSGACPYPGAVLQQFRMVAPAAINPRSSGL